MKKYPLIISAPHACSTIDKKFRDRISLSDYEIWQFSDPFTSETCQHPDAFSINIGNIHRGLGDLCRGYDLDEAFREKDFYGRDVWKEGKSLNDEEKKDLLDNYWKVYRGNLLKEVGKMVKEGFKEILFVDHHNTASEHPAKEGEYISTIAISNNGKKDTGEEDDGGITCPPEFMTFLKKEIHNNLPLVCEINHPYRTSHIIKWIEGEVKKEFPNLIFHSFIVEYNLNLIHNCLTKENDLKAVKILRDGLNISISNLIKKFILKQM